jgi:predicted MFS family arabinose efflux permease
LASNAKLQGSDAAGRTAGPALGGVLVQLLGAPLVLLVDVGSYLFSLWSLTTVRATEPAPAPEPGGRPLRRIGEGVRFVLRDPVLGPITIVATSLNLVEAAFMALQIPFLLRTLSAPPALVGVVLAVGGIGGVAGAGLGARLGARAGTPRALLVAACLAPLFALLFPASFAGAGLVLFGIGVLGREICITMFSLLARSYRQASTPNRLLARVTATVKFLSWGMLPVGSLVGGLLGQTLGNRAALWLIAGVAVLTPLPMLVPPRRGSAVPAGDRVAEQAD